MDQANNAVQIVVEHFRLILLWPFQLMPIGPGAQFQRHWELLEQTGADNPWREVIDEITGDAARFKVRHYAEFVTFLPHVQRFLYGEGIGATSHPVGGESRIRVFRRKDIAQARVTYAAGEPGTVFEVAHVDLYFFLDVDVFILAFEILANGIELTRAQDTLYRFGRAYPSFWDDNGAGSHCLHRVEWLADDGRVLAASDYEHRLKYMSFVRQYRVPCIASHWEFVLSPMVLHNTDPTGLIRYRQIEYYRMPLLAYLALEDPRKLTRADFIRLGLVTEPGSSEVLPYAECHLQDFEYRYCYDRFWAPELGRSATRFICCGMALVAVGHSGEKLFGDPETGVLSKFRHQYFLLFLIAHFHKASLLMFSDRLGLALNRMDLRDAESIRNFKRTTRQLFANFLRFTHRYWSSDISDRNVVQDLFRMCSEHLRTEQLYAQVREETKDMSDFLDSDTLRRQGNTVVRLTVVTTFGLIATVTTGFLGMNLIAATDVPLANKLLYFVLVLMPTVFLILYFVLKSKRLSDLLEALSDERLSAAAKFSALLNVWRKRPRPLI